MQKVFKSYYAAKAAREARERPTDWVIMTERGMYELVQISGFEERVKGTLCTLPELRELGYGMMP